MVSTTPGATPTDILRVALPIGIGLASAAYLTLKLTQSTNSGFSTDKSIPMVPLRPGDSTHDAEYVVDPDAFLARCEKAYGPVFNCHIQGQPLTVVSGPLVREIFTSDHFSFLDALDDMTGLKTYMKAIFKNNDPDHIPSHEIVRDNITPNLPLFTPRIVDLLMMTLEKELGHCERKLVENPFVFIQEMIANATANVFVGPDVAKDRRVINTFIECTYDFGRVLMTFNSKTTWSAFLNRLKYGNKMLNPLQRHVINLTEAATPVIMERRRQEAEIQACIDAGDKDAVYERPLDILQKLLDNFDKYKFVDLEDVFAQILWLVLASVHTTSESSANLCYYLAAYPEYMQSLWDEQEEVLDQITREREQTRQKQLEDSQVASREAFTGTELDPVKDRDFSISTLKRMVKMDSFVREIFRYRAERLQLTHAARQRFTFSNGMYISKGAKVIVNHHSLYQATDLQGEDPSKFRPWRFVGKAKTATKASIDYLPFGMGMHACPGRFLAIQEIKTVGSLLISKYSRIEIQDKSKTKEVLFAKFGAPVPTGLIFTSRGAEFEQ
ncbi:hypothetical protein BGZ83_005603 [Gryganskiella cystojenkinii]|nr:hypothetical protein BGZ83_005603 [Gryganskiella cystojenkinii]